MRSVAVALDPRFAEHAGPPGHPEAPERLTAVAAAISARSEPLARVGARAAEMEELLRVHGRECVERVAEAARRAPAQLDADTFVCERSYEISRLAAGAAIDVALAVARGDVRSGFAAVRPPGHHAEATHPMGFCLFNNAALAARALQAELGVDRTLIFDWDVHHGNGTQHSFEDDPSVLYVSTHQYPYYPGSGGADEAGVGRGMGATLNVPLPAGCGDAEYLAAVQRVVVPAARAFRPEVVIISCGFDAPGDDPLAAMEVSGAGYRGMAACVRALADDLCGGRLVFVLEGGYAASGLREGTDAVLDALLTDIPPPPTAELPAGSVFSRVVEQVVQVHGGRIPNLGASP